MPNVDPPITLAEVTGPRRLRGPAQAVWLFIFDYHSPDGLGLSDLETHQVLYAPVVGVA